MRKLVLIPLLCLSLFAGGCTAQQMQNAANTASKVIAGILTWHGPKRPACRRRRRGDHPVGLARAEP